MELAKMVANEAETQRHHPKMVVEWGQVNISWWTHKIGGLHRNDFVMASKTDDIASGLGYE
jgi:4a-hydroxytetrahydrobiopterin dehydratase